MRKITHEHHFCFKAKKLCFYAVQRFLFVVLHKKRVLRFLDVLAFFSLTTPTHHLQAKQTFIFLRFSFYFSFPSEMTFSLDLHKPGAQAHDLKEFVWECNGLPFKVERNLIFFNETDFRPLSLCGISWDFMSPPYYKILHRNKAETFQIRTLGRLWSLMCFVHLFSALRKGKLKTSVVRGLGSRHKYFYHQHSNDNEHSFDCMIFTIKGIGICTLADQLCKE